MPILLAVNKEEYKAFLVEAKYGALSAKKLGEAFYEYFKLAESDLFASSAIQFLDGRAAEKWIDEYVLKQ